MESGIRESGLDFSVESRNICEEAYAPAGVELSAETALNTRKRIISLCFTRILYILLELFDVQRYDFLCKLTHSIQTIPSIV